MNVTRIQTDTGSHIEPPLDEDWDDFTKLTWSAAVVAHDTGLHVAVHQGGLSRLVHGEWQPVPGMYSIDVGTSSNSSYTFHEAWIFLNGVSVGARKACRATDVAHGWER